MVSGISLGHLRPGESGRVSGMPPDAADIRRLASFGLFPGSEVKVLQTCPVIVLSIGETMIAIDAAIAREVSVENRIGKK